MMFGQLSNRAGLRDLIVALEAHWCKLYICVVSNALLLKAHFPETEIYVDPNCCAGVTPESHEAALKTMAMCQIQMR